MNTGGDGVNPGINLEAARVPSQYFSVPVGRAPRRWAAVGEPFFHRGPSSGIIHVQHDLFIYLLDFIVSSPFSKSARKFLACCWWWLFLLAGFCDVA